MERIKPANCTRVMITGRFEGLVGARTVIQHSRMPVSTWMMKRKSVMPPKKYQ